MRRARSLAGRLAVLVVLMLGTFLAPARSTPSRPAPNVILILADDLGWGDLGCYNAASKIPTPHLDRLAAQGMRFTDAHSPSAVCSPTRYALLTGRYAWRTRLQSGVLWGYSPPLIGPGEATFASFLKTQGYRTACIGKWHLGLRFATREPAEFGDAATPAADPSAIDWSQPLREGPHSVGFEESFCIPASLDMVPYVFLENGRALRAPSRLIPASISQRQGGLGFWRQGPIAEDFEMDRCHPTLIARAEAFVRRQEPGRPFLLYLPLTSPHDPWQPSPEFQGKSGAGPRGDFIHQIDAGVGSILAALDQRGLTTNTLVLFTSDNGAHWLPNEVRSTGHAANGPWRGMKSDAYEGGHRVPLIARLPGVVPPQSVSGHLVGLNDLFATLAELVGQPLPTGVAPDSRSFARILQGRPMRPRDPLVLHSISGVFALRDRSWKWIRDSNGGGWTSGKVTEPRQLYRLDRDPGESTNLWARFPRHAAHFENILAGIRGATPEGTLPR